MFIHLDMNNDKVVVADMSTIGGACPTSQDRRLARALRCALFCALLFLLASVASASSW